jgi:hypothetical protein
MGWHFDFTINITTIVMGFVIPLLFHIAKRLGKIFNLMKDIVWQHNILWDQYTYNNKDWRKHIYRKNT